MVLKLPIILIPQVHELKEADQEPPKPANWYWGETEKKPTLVPPSPATPQNINKAKIIISRLNAAGGQFYDQPKKSTN